MKNKELILNTVEDLVSSFLYYDRKEDEDLPRGAIEDALSNGELKFTDITDKFNSTLYKKLTS